MIQTAGSSQPVQHQSETWSNFHHGHQPCLDKRSTMSHSRATFKVPRGAGLYICRSLVLYSLVFVKAYHISPVQMPAMQADINCWVVKELAGMQSEPVNSLHRIMRSDHVVAGQSNV